MFSPGVPDLHTRCKVPSLEPGVGGLHQGCALASRGKTRLFTRVPQVLSSSLTLPDSLSLCSPCLLSALCSLCSRSE